MNDNGRFLIGVDGHLYKNGRFALEKADGSEKSRLNFQKYTESCYLIQISGQNLSAENCPLLFKKIVQF